MICWNSSAIVVVAWMLIQSSYYHFMAYSLEYPCPSASYTDPFNDLPAFPDFPKVNFDISLIADDEDIVQHHYSELVTLLRPEPRIPSQSQVDCPHLIQDNLLNWHDSDAWDNGIIPDANGMNGTIASNKRVVISSCSIDPSIVLGYITVPDTSELIIGDVNLTIHLHGMIVHGALRAGSPSCRLRSNINLVFHGQRPDGNVEPWVKGIFVNGIIDLHGNEYFPTWTRLAITADEGDTHIVIQDNVNWQPGQEVVITTTELKDSRDWHRNEVKTIKNVFKTHLSDTSVIELTDPLEYNHHGGKEYQAEVALLTRNIVIEGYKNDSEPIDIYPLECVNAHDGSVYPCENSFLTGYGAHVMVAGNTSEGRFSGIELKRVGQTNKLARYPIHFHLLEDGTGSYARDCSVHMSYFRCYAIHGSSNINLTENVGYDAIGHCYFLEDGVEENNIINYNLGAHIHYLGPSHVISAEYAFGSQFLSIFWESENMILPSDLSASPFYITNCYNTFIGNAASGGWAGYAIPALVRPVKVHRHVQSIPAIRPFIIFKGNSAHSTSFWYGSSGGVYIGGSLDHAGNGLLFYNPGRVMGERTRFTCAVDNVQWCGGNQARWLKLEDTKVFLSNGRGIQHWGIRAEIVRFEAINCGISSNVFGEVLVDQMLVVCRSDYHQPTWLSGCPNTPPAWNSGIQWGLCNERDTTYWESFQGFQWYDVAMRHIVTNAHFRNCNSNWQYCMHGCQRASAWTFLAHSDEWVPDTMQATANISYENVNPIMYFSPPVLAFPTVAGRLQNWIDNDGTASNKTTKTKTLLGSTWAKDWWKINDYCTIVPPLWSCEMSQYDDVSSIYFEFNNTLQSQIGTTLCINGGGSRPCPVVGKITHFGRAEATGLDIAVNARVTGPIIHESGGWFVRFDNGTPNTLRITGLQIPPTAKLLLAIPYPSTTNFQITFRSAPWCNTLWYKCSVAFRSVSSIDDILEANGDTYYFDTEKQILFLRIVRPINENAFALAHEPDAPLALQSPLPRFERKEITLFEAAGAARVEIIANNCGGEICSNLPDVEVPRALNAITSAPTKVPTVPPTSPTNMPTKAPTKSPTRNPTLPTSLPTKNPTLPVLPTTGFFGPNQHPIPGGSVKSFDLYLLIDTSRNYQINNVHCVKYKLMSGASPSSCFDLMMDYATETVKAIASSIGYYVDSAKDKGLRVAAYLISCLGTQRTPTSTLLFGLTGDSTIIMNALNQARANTDVSINVAATCPLQGFYDIIQGLENNWAISDQRPYKAVITFTDGLIHDASANAGNALINVVTGIRNRCTQSLVVVPFRYATGTPEATQQTLSLQILTSNNVVSNIFEGKVHPRRVIPKIGEQITTLLLSNVVGKSKCYSSTSYSTSDTYWCGFNRPGLCNPRTSCEFVNGPGCRKKESMNGCVGYLNQSVCDADADCEWKSTKCTRKSEETDCNALVLQQSCLSRSTICDWNSSTSKCVAKSG